VHQSDLPRSLCTHCFKYFKCYIPPYVLQYFLFWGGEGEVQGYEVHDFPDIAELLEDNSVWLKDPFYKHRLSPAFHFL